MDEKRLGELIATVDPPGSADAEVRAVEAVASRLGSAEPGPSPRRRWLWRAVGAALLLALGLSPPGRAVAERVGELVGIGGEATVQTRTSEVYGPVVVVGTGETPGGVPVEIVAFPGQSPGPRGTQGPVGGNPGPSRSRGWQSPTYPRGTCFGVDYPTRSRGGGHELCGTPPGPLPNPGLFHYPDRFGPSARYSLEGTTNSEVAEVEVSYEDVAGERVEAPVIFARVDEAIGERTGAPAGVGFYVAYLPDTGRPEGSLKGPDRSIATVVLRALDADGEVLSSLEYGSELAQAARERGASERRRERILRRILRERRRRLGASGG